MPISSAYFFDSFFFSSLAAAAVRSFSSAISSFKTLAACLSRAFKGNSLAL